MLNCNEREFFVKKKIGRNDPCPCGSRKKFKKCCEKSTLGNKKFLASKSLPARSAGLTHLFHNHASSIRSLGKRAIQVLPSQTSPFQKSAEQREEKKPLEENDQKGT